MICPTCIGSGSFKQVIACNECNGVGTVPYDDPDCLCKRLPDRDCPVHGVSGMDEAW